MHFCEVKGGLRSPSRGLGVPSDPLYQPLNPLQATPQPSLVHRFLWGVFRLHVDVYCIDNTDPVGHFMDTRSERSINAAMTIRSRFTTRYGSLGYHHINYIIFIHSVLLATLSRHRRIVDDKLVNFLLRLITIVRQ